MKLHREQYQRARARLDRLVTIVALLWLAATFVLLLSYRTGSTQAVQPHKARLRAVALYVPQATARASLIY